MPGTTVVSSPGKVLAAGGYLVLDPSYSGVVISTSSRFYAVIQDAGSAYGANVVVVRSPQFVQAEWRYSVHLDRARVVVEEIPSNAGAHDSTRPNKFVHLAIQHTLSLALEVRGVDSLKKDLVNGLDIAIVGDNDFYSQRAKLASMKLTPSTASLSRIPPFCHCRVSISDVHKTGLGSSAALITSLVSALLLHFSVVSPAEFLEDLSVDRRLAHNTAQFVHCLAQGKVGSGFDVSAAVFGSQLYTRFDPVVLQPLMNDEIIHTQSLLTILSPSNKAWNYRVEPFKLPPLIRLMLADVDAGSDTPSLVGQVLKWRQQNPSEATALWTAINNSNQNLAKALVILSDLHSEDPIAYELAVRYISSLQPVQWLANPSISPSEERLVHAFYDVHQFTQDVRANMREMGRLANVPIEPPEQTSLLDACVYQAGVIGGGVPGAGGYDAIWLLVCDAPDSSLQQQPVHRVERVWNTFTSLDVSPLSASESIAKGARIEQLENIPGLKETVFRQ